MKNYNQHIFISKTSYNGETESHRTATNAASLPELIRSFESHLKGAGFIFDGRLDFVDDYGDPMKNTLDKDEFAGYYS